MSFALTHYHAKYFAHDLTKRSRAGDIGNLASTFAGAKVDLNPHQVDAALFAFQSPVPLSDSVELGMMNEIPIEILELPNQLRAKFTGKLPEAESGTPEAIESNFLSRSLAAYAIHKLAGCDLDEAANAVVDGGGDGGIDANPLSTTC